MTSAMALSASHHAAGKRSGSSPASRGNDDLAADEPKKRIKEVLGIREEEQRQRGEWEDAMQAVATSLAVSRNMHTANNHLRTQLNSISLPSLITLSSIYPSFCP
jgi:hypothetical protein